MKHWSFPLAGKYPTPTGESLIAARHSSLSSSVLISEALQPCVPLERIKKGRMWSTSGSLTMRRFPEDELTCSEVWVPQTVPSESHSSLCYLVSQSGRLSYKSIFLTWSSQEKSSATLSIRVYTLSGAFSSSLVACLFQQSLSSMYCFLVKKYRYTTMNTGGSPIIVSDQQSQKWQCAGSNYHQDPEQSHIYHHINGSQGFSIGI